ncbi:hypothetical protein BV20DRAFT_1054061 [Pilatotrama ljubarskyi]|nr:hypothetical protein BV20DRAFT_1054061 [Pilatotrama ljubarskyi]
MATSSSTPTILGTAALTPAAQGAAQPPFVNIVYGPSAHVITLPTVPMKRKQAPKISSVQHTAMMAASQTKQEELQVELDGQYDNTKAFAVLMFFGSVNPLKDRKANAYNAWSHSLAKEINEDAEPGNG